MDEDDACPGPPDRFEMALGQDEGNIAGTGPVQWRQTMRAASGVSDHIAVEQLGQLRCGETGFSGVAAWRQ